MKTTLLFFFVSCATAFAQNQNLSNTSNFNGEPYLAINPTNPQNIVVAWMHVNLINRPIRTRTTFDGGITWQPYVDLPIANTNTADPTMAFDNNGNLHLCFIDHLGSSSPTNNGGVYSYTSYDGGLSWGNQSVVIDINADGAHQPIDRPWLVCDRSGGLNDGNLYLTTKVVAGTPAPYHPYFVQSTDGGTSWSNWAYVDTTGWLSSIGSTFAAPTVTSDGVFAAVYPSYETSQSPIPKYLMAYINNNTSNTFDYKTSINNLPTVSNDSAKRGWQFVSNPFDSDHLSFFYTNGPDGDLDIYMTETYDFGDNWTTPLRVNDDPIGNGILQDMIWASFDTDGDLVVCWRDRRNSGGQGYAQPSEIFGRIRWHDSTDFSPSFIVTDTIADYNNVLSQSGNDFMCHQLLNDTLYISWADTKTGFLNIWFDKIAMTSGNSVGLTNLAGSELPIVKVYPNPSNEWVNLEIDELHLESIVVLDMDGRVVIRPEALKFSVSDLPTGSYVIRILTSETTIIRKLVVN
ncbi:MAG: T9SS type A sorting domain-containing protein [Crocinitomicaceae bacterium]